MNIFEAKAISLLVSQLDDDDSGNTVQDSLDTFDRTELIALRQLFTNSLTDIETYMASRGIDLRSFKFSAES